MNVEDGTGIRLEPIVESERRIEERDGVLVLLAPDHEHDAVTDDLVRDLRDSMQR